METSLRRKSRCWVTYRLAGVAFLLLSLSVAWSQNQKDVAMLDIGEAIAARLISVEAKGANISEVKVKVKRLGGKARSILVPAGTLFVSRDERTQDMVVTEDTTIKLTEREATRSIPAACVNPAKKVPNRKSRFDVFIYLPFRCEEPEKLARKVKDENLGKSILQVAIWIAFNNPSRKTINEKYAEGFGEPLEPDDVIRAIKIVEEVGIEVREKIIVQEKISAIMGLGSENTEISAYAAKLLGIKEEERRDFLFAALKNEDASIRRYAAWTLGRLRDPRAVEPLIDALQDKDREVRLTAAWSLGKLKDFRAVEPLINLLKDRDFENQVIVFRALQEITEGRGASSSLYEEWQKWWEENRPRE
jgi:hypothetical protein